jgi:hypothetical protein
MPVFFLSHNSAQMLLSPSQVHKLNSDLNPLWFPMIEYLCKFNLGRLSSAFMLCLPLKWNFLHGVCSVQVVSSLCKPLLSWWDFGFCWWRLWRWHPSRMFCRVVSKKLTDVWEVFTAVIMSLMMEALTISKTSVNFYETTGCNIL